MAQVTTVQPNSIPTVTGGLGIVGTAATCLSDGNDATGLSQTSSTAGYARVLFPWPAIPANSTILGYSISVRAKNTNGKTDRAYFGNIQSPVTPINDVYVIPTTTAFTTYQPGQRKSVGGTALTPSNLSAFAVDFYIATNTVFISELAVIITYVTPPTATITAPTASQVELSQGPPVTWTFSDPQGDYQDGFDIQIQDAADNVLYDSGYLRGPQTTYTIPVTLPTGVNLQALVGVANNELPTSIGWSAPVTFSVLPFTLPTPDLSAVWDSALGRVEVTVTDHSNSAPGAASLGNDGTTGFSTTNATTSSVTASGWVAPGQPTPPKVIQASSVASGAVVVNLPNAACIPGKVLAFVVALKAGTIPVGSTTVTLHCTGASDPSGNTATASITTSSFTVFSGQVTVPAGATAVHLSIAPPNASAASQTLFISGYGMFPNTTLSRLTTEQLPSGAAATGVPAWTPGGGTSSTAQNPAAIYLERSSDGGQTWTGVRYAYGVAGSFDQVTAGFVAPVAGQPILFCDYEAPPASRTVYRVHQAMSPSASVATVPNLSSPVSPYLPNASFETGTAAWSTGTSPTTPTVGAGNDTTTPHPGIWTTDWQMPTVSTNNFWVIVPPWQTTARFRGWLKTQNTGASLGVQIWQWTGTGGTGTQVGSTLPVIPATANDSGWVLFDTGDLAITSSGLIQIVVVTPAAGTGALTTFASLDDFEYLPGGAYVVVDNQQAWFKDPQVPSLNCPVVIEPGSGPGNTSSTVYGVTSEGDRSGQVILYPEGNVNPVVISPVRSANVFKAVSMMVTGDAAADQIKQMLASGRTNLLQLNTGVERGEQAYVTVTGADSGVRFASNDVAADIPNAQRWRFVADLQTVAAP